MKLVIMTKPTFFVEEDKILSSLFDEGMDNLHLFKPESSPMYSERLLSLLPDEYYDHISVHEHFYLKEEYRLRGIHLDNWQTPLPEGYKGHVSRTCRNLAELKEAKRKADYVFLDGVFATKGAPARFTAEELQQAAADGLIDKKVYALGGVSLETVPAARNLGFGGVVADDDLWKRFDIYHGLDFKDLMQHFEKLRKVAG